MTNTTDKAMREAFEAWAVEEGFAWIEDACEILNEPAKFRWNPYNDCGKAGAWLAWQAALASSAAAPEQAAKAGPDRAERGTPCELKDCDPDSPTYRQWFPARFVATDLVGGEPIVQKDLCMPVFATWASVRFITRPPAPLSEPTAEGVTETMFLVCAGGDDYQSEVVPQSRLDDAYLLTQWGSLAGITAEEKAEVLSNFHDPDQWLHMDPLRGGSGRVPVEFSVDFEDGWVRVVRLPAPSSPASSAGMDAQRLFSPMHLAPLDGTPVLLHIPTATDKFAVGRWTDGHGSGWIDDEERFLTHTPVSFMSLGHLETYTIAAIASKEQP